MHPFTLHSNLGAQPDFTALSTILADVNFGTSPQELGPEVVVSGAPPHFREGGFLEVSQAMGYVLVEAAGGHEPIPGDHATVPELPAVIAQLIFYAVGAVGLAVVAGVGFVGGMRGLPCS
jgi:hypothetical protein